MVERLLFGRMKRTKCICCELLGNLFSKQKNCERDRLCFSVLFDGSRCVVVWLIDGITTIRFVGREHGEKLFPYQGQRFPTQRRAGVSKTSLQDLGNTAARWSIPIRVRLNVVPALDDQEFCPCRICTGFYHVRTRSIFVGCEWFLWTEEPGYKKVQWCTGFHMHRIRSHMS